MLKIINLIKVWLNKFFDKKSKLPYIQVAKEEEMKKSNSKEDETPVQAEPSFSHVALSRIEDEEGNIYHIRVLFDPNQEKCKIEKTKCINVDEANEMFLIDCGRYEIT